MGVRDVKDALKFSNSIFRGLGHGGSSSTHKAQWKCKWVVGKEIIETSSCRGCADVVMVWRYTQKHGFLFFFLFLLILPRRNAALIPQTPSFGSNSLYCDVLIATVSCNTLRPPNHLYVISLYDNRTGVDQCLWLSIVLVILVRDSWVNRWSTFSGRIVVVLKN